MTLRVPMIARAAALLISAAIVVPQAANAAAAGFSSLGTNGGWSYNATGGLTFGNNGGKSKVGYSTSYKKLTYIGGKYVWVSSSFTKNAKNINAASTNVYSDPKTGNVGFTKNND